MTEFKKGDRVRLESSVGIDGTVSAVFDPRWNYSVEVIWDHANGFRRAYAPKRLVLLSAVDQLGELAGGVEQG